MREFRKWVWTAVIAAAATTPVAAQQGTVTTGGGVTTSSLTGTGGLAGGGAGQLGSGGGGGGGQGGGQGGLGGSALQGTQLQQMQAAPQLTAPTGTARSSLNSSNRFAGYYANPYFQGNSLQVNAVPGGFGIATTTGATGAAGLGGTATRGTTLGGGIGGRGGLGGQTGTSQSGILIPVQVQMNYTAQMQFPTPPVAAGKIAAEVRSVIDNTPMISNSKGVQIITDADNNVTLRGNVKNDEEARLIEGLVRITPGVGGIKNELAFPVASR